MEDDTSSSSSSSLPLQFAVGLLHCLPPAANSPVDDPRAVLDDVAAQLRALPFPKLKEANCFLESAVANLRRDFRSADAGDDLREAKERALDEFVTGLGGEDKLDVVKFVVVVEMLLFCNSFPRCRTVQERIRCIQTTRRVCNVHLKKVNGIREMLLFLVDKLCRHEGVGKSETWFKEGGEIVDLAEEEVVAPEVEAAKTAFVIAVYVVNVQTQAFLEFVQSDLVAKSPGLVADVVGPLRCESELKVNVTTMKLDDVMWGLYKATRSEQVRILMDYPVLEEEEELEVEG